MFYKWGNWRPKKLRDSLKSESLYVHGQDTNPGCLFLEYVLLTVMWGMTRVKSYEVLTVSNPFKKKKKKSIRMTPFMLSQFSPLQTQPITHTMNALIRSSPLHCDPNTCSTPSPYFYSLSLTDRTNFISLLRADSSNFGSNLVLPTQIFSSPI